jgi:hypothetical protein
MEMRPVSYADSPEVIASRLRSEISCSESKTHSLIYNAESRLEKRIHELEMSLIKKGGDDFAMLAMALIFFTFMTVMCLASHSHESTNTEPTSQTAHPETSASQAARALEAGK